MAPERYEDEDVRRHWDEYSSLAGRFLLNYHGSFAVLNKFKHIVMSDENLTIKEVRTTLNCMLLDPRVTNMPNPDRSILDAGGLVDEKIANRRTPVIERHRAPFIEMNSRVRFKYGISNMKQAYTIHLVDPDYRPVVWYPRVSGFAVRTKWICTSEQRTHKNSILLDLDRMLRLLGKPAFNDRIWQECKTCIRWKAERDERQAEIDARFKATQL